MPMKIADSSQAAPDVDPIPPTPLAERLKERVPDAERDERPRQRRQDAGNALLLAMQAPVQASLLLQAEAQAVPQGQRAAALQAGSPGTMAAAELRAFEAPVQVSGKGTVQASAAGSAAMRSQETPQAPPQPLQAPAQQAVQAGAEPQLSRPAHIAADAAAVTERPLHDSTGGSRAAAATATEVLAAPPLSPTTSAALIATADTVQQAYRQSQAVAQQHQQARSEFHLHAMQQAQSTRVEAGTRMDVAFRSWGEGHAVVARVEGNRLLLQPSSSRVEQALTGCALPGEVDLQLAVESATDRQPRKRREPS